MVLLGWGAYVLAHALDVAAFRSCLRLLGSRCRYLTIARAHLSSEATMLSLPLGVVVAEPLRAYLLRRDGGVAVANGVAATAARKYLLMAAQGVVVALGAVVGSDVLQSASLTITGTPYLAWASWGVALLLVSLAAGYALVLGKGAVARRSLDLAARLAPARLQPVLERARLGFVETDASLGRFFRTPHRKLIMPFLAYLGMWLLEACETYLVLRFLGADVSFAVALCIEGVVTFARSVVAVLPAGLGVQDMGYVLFLRAVGVPNSLDMAAAFSLLKRSKEALWIALGYSLLLLRGPRPVWTPSEASSGAPFEAQYSRHTR